MKREKLVETAARATHAWSLADGGECVSWDDLPGWVRVDYLNGARAALDAVLPQVTTVEQVRALPRYSYVLVPVMRSVWVMRWDGAALVDIEDMQGSADRNYEPSWVLDRYGPLTVVYRPEVTA